MGEGHDGDVLGGRRGALRPPGVRGRTSSGKADPSREADDGDLLGPCALVPAVNDVIAQWLPAVIAVAAWPVGIVVMVLGVLLVPRGQQVAVLAGIAEVIRAARARTAISPPASRAELRSASPMRGEQGAQPNGPR